VTPLPLPAAADALGVTVPTLRRWIRAGAPLARRGRRGRGRQALVDVRAIEAWRASQAPTLAAAAAGLPEVLAAVVERAVLEADGLPKARMAGWAAGLWYSCSVAVLDSLRQHDPAVGDVSTVPLAVERLRKIAGA
jgi:hypothetical protein